MLISTRECRWQCLGAVTEQSDLTSRAAVRVKSAGLPPWWMESDLINGSGRAGRWGRRLLPLHGKPPLGFNTHPDLSAKPFLRMLYRKSSGPKVDPPPSPPSCWIRSHSFPSLSNLFCTFAVMPLFVGEDGFTGLWRVRLGAGGQHYGQLELTVCESWRYQASSRKCHTLNYPFNSLCGAQVLLEKPVSYSHHFSWNQDLLDQTGLHLRGYRTNQPPGQDLFATKW